MTRADFYVGRGKDARWIYSVRDLGDPKSIQRRVLNATTEAEFICTLASQLALMRPSLTVMPTDGWPWPWPDSTRSDYAYAFDEGKVWASHMGRTWFDPLDPPTEHGPKEAVFPDMTAKRLMMAEHFGIKP